MKKGFTLIEFLVTISIFFIVISGFVSLFSFGLKIQKENLISAYFLNNVSYISDYLARSLRMAQKDIDGVCINAKFNYENPKGDFSRIRFLNYENKCQEFLIEDGQLKVKRSSDASSVNLKESVSLTPSGIIIENGRFKIYGSSQEDQLQPKVTFILIVKTKDPFSQSLNLQTTISQRELDIRY